MKENKMEPNSLQLADKVKRLQAQLNEAIEELRKSKETE